MRRIPILGLAELVPPVVLCVALDRTDGVFEANVTRQGLTDGVDYFHFA